MALTERYRSRHSGWHGKHVYGWYRRDGGLRSYPWVQHSWQGAGLVGTINPRGNPRTRRHRAPLPGVGVPQEASRHEWVAGQQWDRVMTIAEVPNEHESMFFVAEAGTAARFRGMRATMLGQGLFSAL